MNILSLFKRIWIKVTNTNNKIAENKDSNKTKQQNKILDEPYDPYN